MNWFKKHKVITIIIAVVIVIAIAGGANSDKSGNTEKKATNTSSSEKKETSAKIGEAVRDGKFEFTVKSLECGKTSVGGQYLNKTAQGQYCLLNVNVKNIGTEKQSLFSANQKLLNGGNEYSADDTATIYAAPQGSSWYSDINPGNSVDGTIVFDVPKDITPATAELHDSAFSDGVRVVIK